MSNFFLKPALLGLLLLGGGLGAQSVATEPQKRTWPVHVPVYMQPAQVDPAKVLGPPPVPGSLAAAADLEAVLMAQAFRTPEQEAWARYIDTDGVFKHAPEIGPWFKAPLCASQTPPGGRHNSPLRPASREHLVPQRSLHAGLPRGFDPGGPASREAGSAHESRPPGGLEPDHRRGPLPHRRHRGSPAGPGHP
ncbi:MAG: hypothetical protein H6Q00_3078 [Holophagaceae bacterium]|nr:hypothetical protein [Holophagaceae bacterium]